MGKTRMGFIGVGLRGAGQARRVAETFANRAEVVALADVNEENLRRCAQSLPGAEPDAYAHWSKVLERDDVDAVCISTPQYTHEEITLAAFDAGKHVYCEKPLALTVAACDRMIDASRKAGKVFVVGQQMRYHAHLNRMSELVDRDLIGTPQLAWLKEFRNPFPHNMVWAFDKTKSGGGIVEKSCHHFDVFSWMLRAPAVRVLASGGQAVHKQIFGVQSDIVDHAWVTVEHEHGRKAMLGLCFFAGLPHTHEGGSGTHMRDIGLVGDKGMVTTEGFHQGRNLEVHFSDRPDVVRIDVPEPKRPGKGLFERGGNFGIWTDFFNCVDRGGEPIADGRVGRDALAVALAAERAIETGRPVLVSDVA